MLILFCKLLITRNLKKRQLQNVFYAPMFIFLNNYICTNLFCIRFLFDILLP